MLQVRKLVQMHHIARQADRWRAALRYVGAPRRPPSVTPHRAGPLRR